MKAVIQAGGKGTRLAPYSTVLPKALMPIGDGTVIDHTLAMFAGAGVQVVYITVSKFGPLIRSYCGDGSRWGLKLEYIEESQPLGTIGPLGSMRDKLDGTFLTVVVTNQTVKIEYGVLDQSDGTVTGFREKPIEQFCVSTGIYCMEPSILDFVPNGQAFGFDELVRTMLATQTPISAYTHPGQWIDIGRIEDLRRAQEHAASQLMAKSRGASDE
jgi:mannose-1-phosphate guanylyltransferase